MSGDTYAWWGVWDGSSGSWAYGGRLSADWYGRTGQLMDTTGTTSTARYIISLSHYHDMNHIHRINSDGGDESRPNNYSYTIWKRIA